MPRDHQQCLHISTNIEMIYKVIPFSSVKIDNVLKCLSKVLPINRRPMCDESHISPSLFAALYNVYGIQTL